MAVPETTTASPTNTTLPAEVSPVIPDAGTEKAVGGTSETSAPVQPAPAPGVTEEKTSTDTAAAVAPAPGALTAATVAADSKLPSPIQELWAAAKENGHPEIWGVTLADPDTHVPSQIVLQKYLNANDGDLTKSKDQLVKTLQWRAKMKPLELLNKTFSKQKFDGLGYVTSYGEGLVGEGKEVFTWNIYGGVTKLDETFGNLEEFIEWRVALMEFALQELALASAAKPITATEDPYKIFQVHDYKGISFFRSPPVVKTASKETITVFAQNYPELLKEKFFINVPAIMGFMYGVIKVFAPAKTVKKFHPMSNGGALALEFGESKVVGLGEQLPKEYGGKGDDLKVAGKETALQ